MFASASSVTGVLTPLRGVGETIACQSEPHAAKLSIYTGRIRKNPHLKQELGKVAYLMMQNQCASTK